MSRTLNDRVLALAGLAQALKQVRRVAETGQADMASLTTSLDSIFRIDAATTELVYGGAHALRPGLTALRDYFRNESPDQLLPRLALAVLQLERNFVRQPATVDKVGDGIARLAPLAGAQGSSSAPVLAGLGKLYAETLSHLRPKVMVQGNPHYLGQGDVVAEIRAMLLAAVRSAVLWRQMGGTLWDFVLQRRQMLQVVDQLLA